MTKLKDLYNYIFNIPTSTLHRKIYEGKDGKREIDFTVNTYPRLTGDMTQRVDTTDVYNYNPATNAVTIIPNMSDSSNVMYIPSYDARSGEMWLVLPMQNLSSRNRAILVTRNLMSEATNKQNTTKKQIGGTMNYATYLQQGGQASSKKDQLKALVIEALQNAGSEEEINNIMSQLQEMAGQDQDAAQVFQEIMEEMQTQSMKCGGKVRAKIKKTKKCETGDTLTKDLKNILMAAKCGGKAKKTKKCAEGGELTLDFSMIDFAKCGKKLQKKEVGGKVAEEKCGGKAKKVKKAELGAPHGIKKEWKDSSYSVTNFSKGGCPCQYKREGGKIITVDCNGLPLHKQGGEMVFKFDGGGLFDNVNITDKTLAGRQKWVQDNAKYLEDIGWTPEEISGYRGQTALLNYRLRDAINNYSNWLAIHPDAAGATGEVGSTSAAGATGTEASTAGATGEVGSTSAAGATGTEASTAGATTPVYTRNARGVYQDTNGNIDWTRSVNGDQYSKNVMNYVNNNYEKNRQTLRANRADIIKSQGLHGYFDAIRAAKDTRSQDRIAAKLAANAYTSKRVNEYVTPLISGLLNQVATGGAQPESNPITFKNSFTFDPNGASQFKNGGIISFKEYLK